MSQQRIEGALRRQQLCSLSRWRRPVVFLAVVLSASSWPVTFRGISPPHSSRGRTALQATSRVGMKPGTWRRDEVERQLLAIQDVIERLGGQKFLDNLDDEGMMKLLKAASLVWSDSSNLPPSARREVGMLLKEFEQMNLTAMSDSEIKSEFNLLKVKLGFGSYQGSAAAARPLPAQGTQRRGKPGAAVVQAKAKVQQTRKQVDSQLSSGAQVKKREAPRQEESKGMQKLLLGQEAQRPSGARRAEEVDIKGGTKQEPPKPKMEAAKGVASPAAAKPIVEPKVPVPAGGAVQVAEVKAPVAASVNSTSSDASEVKALKAKLDGLQTRLKESERLLYEAESSRDGVELELMDAQEDLEEAGKVNQVLQSRIEILEDNITTYEQELEVMEALQAELKKEKEAAARILALLRNLGREKSIKGWSSLLMVNVMSAEEIIAAISEKK